MCGVAGVFETDGASGVVANILFAIQHRGARHGFRTIGFQWYHYHAAPPMLAAKIGQGFRADSIRLEHEGSWRGMFLCSAGIIEAELSA